MTPRLTLRPADLKKALRTLERAAGAKPGVEALLSFDGSSLEVAVGGGSVSVAAHGFWPGTARVPFSVLAAIQRVSPHDDVELVVDDGQLRVGTFSVECIWTEGEQLVLWLPVNPRTADYVALRLCHTDEEILRAGMFEAVEKACAERDRLVRSASATLAPLGIRESVLLEWVNAKVKSAFERGA